MTLPPLSGRSAPRSPPPASLTGSEFSEFNFQSLDNGQRLCACAPSPNPKALRTRPWPPPKNGVHYVVPEVAALLATLPDVYGYKGDYLNRARALGFTRKTNNQCCHQAQRWAIDPSSVHLTRGKPRYVQPGTLGAAGAVASGGPTAGYLQCKEEVNAAKKAYFAKRGINEVRPAAKNTVRCSAPVAPARIPCMINHSDHASALLPPPTRAIAPPTLPRLGRPTCTSTYHSLTPSPPGVFSGPTSFPWAAGPH